MFKSMEYTDSMIFGVRGVALKTKLSDLALTTLELIKGSRKLA